MPVLYEQEVKDRKGLYEGLTPNYIRVLSFGNNSLIGNIVKTRLIKVENESVLGDCIKFPLVL